MEVSGLWGAIEGGGTKISCVCPSILNTYQNVLRTALLPLLNSTSIFMQDGVPCLLSDWPAQYPDLNIIGNLWTTLKKSVSSRHPKDKEDLCVILQEEWSKVDSSVVKKAL